ncbi:MAG TPA: P-loop NTPase fold protein [Gaiellaceae bacterium]|nr:P-loop NTPase fold protein [Gaiellaceae bacterium]
MPKIPKGRTQRISSQRQIPPLFSDQPIRTGDQDELGSEAFVDRLLRPLLEWPATDSLVVGLYGPWGAGKTSILNLVEGALRSDEWKERVAVARFDPWLYSDHLTLLRGFFAMLQDATASTPLLTPKRKAALREGLSGMSRWLVPIVAGAWTAHTGAPNMAVPATVAINTALDLGLSSDEPSFDVEKQKAIAALSKLGRSSVGARLVVLIDDMDRLGIAETHAMLKLIRLIADLPNVTYVVAMDHDRVQQLLSDSRDGFGQAYLEKIIQVPLQIPPVSRQTVRRLLISGIDAVFNSGEAKTDSIERRFEDRGLSLDDIVFWRIRNLRDRARLLNLLRFKLLAGPERLDVDPVDAMLVALVETFFPPLIGRLRENKDFLTAQEGMLGLAWRASGREADYAAARRRTLAALVSGDEEMTELSRGDGPANVSLGHDDSQLARRLEFTRLRAIVAALFPNAESGAEPTVEQQTEWRIQNRISSPERFDRYFTATPPHDEVSDAFVGSWLEVVENVLADRTAGAIDQSNIEILLRPVRNIDKTKRSSFWAKIGDRLNTLPPQTLAALSELAARGVCDALISDTDGADVVRGVLRTLASADEELDIEKLDSSEAVDTSASTDLSDAIARAHAAFAELVDSADDPIDAWEAAANHVTAWSSRQQRDTEHDGAGKLSGALQPVADAGMRRVSEFVHVGRLSEITDGQAFAAAIWRWRDLLRVQGLAFTPIKVQLNGYLQDYPERLPTVLGLLAGWSNDEPTLRHTTYTEIRTAAEEVIGWCSLLRAVIRFKHLEPGGERRYGVLVGQFEKRVMAHAKG